MNDLKIFSHSTFGEVRTILKEGEPWFVAKDVAEKLGYANTKDAIYSHVDEEDKTIIQRSEIATFENRIPKDALPMDFVHAIPNRGLTIINESGVYSLVLRSHLPEAKAFKRWITHEVIPSIRKHGAYMTPETVEQVLSNPDTIIRLATELKQARETNQMLSIQNSALTVSNQIMQPKADYFDELVDRNLLTNFRVTAKELKVKEREFISFLLGRKYLYRDAKGNLLPHSSHAQDGLFEVKETYNQKTDWRGTQTLVTPKGRETFRLLMIGGGV